MRSKSTLIRSIFIGAIFVLTQLSGTLYTPSMPTLATAFNVDSSSIMLTLSIFFFGMMLGQLLWGTASDYFGRKKTLLISLLPYIVVATAITFVHQYKYFALFISLLGFIAAAYTSIGNALLKDLYGKQAGKAIGYIGIVMAIAPTLAPVIGAHLLTWFGWQAIYVFLAALAFICFLAIYALIEDTPAKHSHHEQTTLLSTLHMIMRHPKFLAFVLPLALSFGAFFTYLGAAPFIFIKYFGYSTTQFGYIVFATMLTYIIGTIYNSVAQKHFDSSKILFRGLIISSIGLLFAFILTVLEIHTLWLLILAFSIFMFGNGLISPAAKAGAMHVFTNHSGKSASLMKFTQMLGCVVITALASQLHSTTSIVPISALLLTVTLLALVSYLVFTAVK